MTTHVIIYNDDMSETLLISDTHFFHGNVISYCNRPFQSADEMNHVLITNWNNTVSPNDTVYFLGDFAFCNKKKSLELFHQLNGNIIVVKGNHDRGELFWSEAGVKDYHTQPLIFEKFYKLSHYPLEKHELMPFINIHGHIHNKRMKDTNYFNVSVECINYKPISFDEIKEKYE